MSVLPTTKKEDEEDLEKRSERDNDDDDGEEQLDTSTFYFCRYNDHHNNDESGNIIMTFQTTAAAAAAATVRNVALLFVLVAVFLLTFEHARWANTSTPPNNNNTTKNDHWYFYRSSTRHRRLQTPSSQQQKQEQHAAAMTVSTATATASTSTTKCDGTTKLNGNDAASSVIAVADVLDKTDPIFMLHDVDANNPNYDDDNSAWGDDPIVVPSHKLVFFSIAKNGSSEWKVLLRKMMGLNETDDDGIPIDVHNPATNGLTYLRHFPISQQEEIMTSPNWTRAVFVRDPMERLLSAYLNKGFDGHHMYHHCCNPGDALLRVGENGTAALWLEQNDIYQQQCQILEEHQWKDGVTVDDFPFENFVLGGFMEQCADVHWKLQRQRLHDDNWQFINFWGKFERLQEDARCLLERIGAWKEYGASGWGPHGKMSFLDRKNAAGHATGAKQKSRNSLSDYIQSKLVFERVMEYLRPDYDFEPFRFTKPQMSF